MKSWIKSKIVWLGSAGALLGVADFVIQFLNSGQLNTLCQQKSAISAAISTFIVIFRFSSDEKIYIRKPNGNQ